MIEFTWSKLVTGIMLMAGIFLFTMCSRQEKKVEKQAADDTTKSEGGELMKRSEIDPKYKWDLTDLYENDKAWEADYEMIKKKSTDYKKFEGILGKSAESLLSFLKFDEVISNGMEKLYQYSSLSKDLNLSNQNYQAMYEKAQNLYNEIGAITSFVRPEILQIPIDKLNSYINSNNELRHFRHYFDNLIRFKPYTLSKSEEKIMALEGPVGETFMTTYTLFTNADMKYPTIKGENGEDWEMSAARYYTAMYSTNRDFRRRAYKATYVPFMDNINFFTSNYNGSIKAKIFNAKARGYKNTLEAALFQNNIPVDVYKNLIKTVDANLAPLQRWGKLKKDVLKLDELHVYDTYVTLFPAVNKKYTPDDAMDICLKALSPLGEQYIKDLKYAFDHRWVDFYETDNKKNGAYSTGAVKGVHPYVLLNWGYTINDVFTLAHEMGHNMHSFYTSNNQKYPYSDYPIFVAEVASITNETLLLRYLIDNAESREEKMSLIETALNNIKGTFYRQARFAEFEMKVQAAIESGEAMTADKYAEIFGDLYKKFWGEHMVMDEEERNSWPRIHHFYYNFYVYQYATSLCAAEAIVATISIEGQPAIDKYLNFLRSGKTKYAIDLLKDMDVDMTQPKPVLAVIEKADLLLNELQDLLQQ